MINRIIHNIGAFLGVVGYRRCVENECKKYCGTSPSGMLLFNLEKGVSEHKGTVIITQYEKTVTK